MTYISLRQALGAIDAAQAAGLDIPPEIAEAIAIRDAITAAGHTDNSPPDIPPTARDVHKTLTEYGRRLSVAYGIKQGVAEMNKHSDGVVVRAVAAAVPAWITELADLYDASVYRLTQDLQHVPDTAGQRDLGHAPGPVFAAWLRCEADARTLDDLIHTRNALSTAAGEEPIRDKRLLAAITFPTPGDGATWTYQHGPVLLDWKDAARRPVERWRHLIRHDAFALTLARLGEPHQRAEIRDEWQHRAQARHGRIMR